MLYITAAAVRIQSWLLRTPTLKLMRGASANLARATGNEAIETALRNWGFDHARIADDSGDIDGVVVIATTEASDGPAIADRLLGHLHSELPGAEWEAWWGEADSYAEAYIAMARGDASVGRMSLLGSLYEATLVESCPGCKSEYAGSGISRSMEIASSSIAPPGCKSECAGSGITHYGADCTARLQEADDPYDYFPVAPRKPGDFKELAQINRFAGTSQAVGRRDGWNHLATITADGNGIGRAFELIRDKHPGAALSEAVAALEDATKGAIGDALTSVAPSSDTSPAIVHLVGGDDVFVSLPARLGWQFAYQLAAAFESRLKEFGTTYGVPVPTLGVGMAFSHYRHPIADAHAVAERCLSQSKRLTRATESAIVWADLTAESDVPRERIRTLADLGQDRSGDGIGKSPAAAVRQEVLGLPPSARSSLAELLTAPGSQDERDTMLRTAMWATRTRRTQLARAVDSYGREGFGFRSLLESSLSQARWWPLHAPAGGED